MKLLKASVKVRLEIMDRLALEAIAEKDGLDLSDIGRRALKEYIRTRTPQPNQPMQEITRVAA